MTCILKNLYKSEIEDLKKIVGSEDAAYYLLCANNGYTLDKTPQGEDSALYSALCDLYQGDLNKAVLAKAQVYLPEMGDWVDNPLSTDLQLDKLGEPSIKYLASKSDGEISTTWKANDITNLLADEGKLNSTLNILRDNNIINREIPILNAIRSSRNAFVDAYLQEVSKYEEITPVARYLRSMDAKMIWDERKRLEVIDLIRKRLAKEFGLKEVHQGKDVFFESADDSVGGKMRVRLVNNLHKFVEGAQKDDKGVFIEDIDHELSMLYISLENGDHTTIVHELAHWYIRRFWETLPVQDALKVMLKRKDKSSIEIEERLVNKLIKTLEGDEKQSSNFWSAIKKFANKLFSTISNKQEILDDLVAYFAINKDISDLQAEIIYVDKIYAPVWQKNATKEEKNILKAIKTAVSSRIEAISHDPMRNNKTLAEVRTLDFDLSALDSLDSDDVKKAIKMILDACMYELSNTVISIMAQAELRGVNNLDVRLFAKLKTDTLGYYVYLVNSKINEIFSAKNPDDDFKTNSDLYRYVLSTSLYLNALTTRYDAITKRWVDWYIDQAAEELVTFADKEIWKVNAKHWVRNEINNGGLSQFNKLFGAINSDSPIINLVDHLVRRANNYVRPLAEQVGHKLTSLYDSYTNHMDVLPANGFRDFCELSYSRDFNGKRGLTGNFRRAENWGEMQAAVDKEKIRVAKLLDIELDDNLRFDWHAVTIELYNKFYDAMDDFYEKNDVVRKYKPDYYRMQRKFQSPETIELKKELQEQIDLLESKCRNQKTGILETFKLSQEERNKLKDLKKQKKNLGNPYNIELDEQGNIISIKLKDPDSPEGIVANEIIAFNDAIRGKIKYKPDWEKYDADLQQLKNQGLLPWELAMWQEDNTTHKIREGILLTGGSRGFKIAQLYAMRSAIIEAAKGRPGHWEPKLWRLSDEAWQELKEIDQAIDDYEKEEGYVKPKGKVDPDADVSNIDVFHYEGDVKTDQTEYQYQLDKYYTMSQVDPTAMSTFEKKFHYISKEKDDYGNTIFIQLPLSVFRMLNVGAWEEAPGLVYEGVVDEPSGKYVKLDKNSLLVESDFDENYSAYIQPRKNGKWHDKGFEELYGNGKTKYAKLYDTMILYMGEIYSNYGMTDTNKYQLPGIRDNMSHSLHRKGYATIGNIKLNLGLNETDTNYNEEKHMRPDGTQIEVLPMRWIRKLDNPNLTSTDLISTISAMYEASLNYKERSSILPVIELLTVPMGGEFNRASDAASVEQREYLRNYIEMYIYDKKRTIKHGNITLNKLADTAMAKTHSKLMAHNWKVVIKNAIDSFWNFTKEVAGGKYFTAKDAIAADIVLAKEILLNIFRNVGIANSRTLTDAILRRNGVGGSISEIFKGQRSSGLRRFLAKHFNMGEYSLVDYTFKGNIALSVYHNHRLIENPLTKKKEFMNKWLAAYIYSKAGLSENDGIKVWSKAGNLFNGKTLLDAFFVDKEGNLQVKSEYIDTIRPIKNGRRSNLLETRIETIIRERSSVINGMLDEMDRVAFMRTMVGAMACLMRGWMFSLSADNFKKGSQFMVRDEDLDDFGYTANGVDEKGASFYESEEYRWAIANLSTGFVEAGAQRRLLRSYGRCISAIIKLNKISKVQKPTKLDKYRFRMMNVSLLSMAATIALGVLFGRMVEDDPDDWASNFSYAVNTGAMSERVSQLPAGVAVSMMELIRSLFVANALYQDLGSIPDVIVDAGEWWAYEHGYVNNPHFKEEIKRGGYTGTPVWFMHASKASSILFPNYSWNNIFKNFSNSSNVSSANFYNNQFPISWINYLPDRGTGSKKTNLSTTVFGSIFENADINPFNAD